MNLTEPTQISFAQAEYEKKKKRTRREMFLEKMEQVVPWCRLMEVIEPHYPRSGKRGRPPIGLQRMLRMYFVQQWYGLADEAVEDAIYDSQALRNFMGIDLCRQSVPDATTLMGFRHLLEANDLTKAMLVEVNVMLMERGLLMTQGTLVDATLIAAPSSTKNQEHGRDPEMHQAKKGNQWYFGSATCKSHGFLFHRRTYELMKPVVPPTVPYLDMRCWQRHGVKLQGQRTLRFIRCVKPRGETNSASTTAERGQG